MKKFVVAFVVLLAANAAVGQYTASYSDPVTDVTPLIKIGAINAWKPTTGGCQQRSLSVSTEGNIWCVGGDHAVYKADSRNSTSWVRHPEMGTAVVAMAVQNDSAIYSLQHSGYCDGYPPDLAMFKWSGSAWTPLNAYRCVGILSPANDGFLAAVDRGQKSYYSTDGGANWNSWVNGWKFVNMWNSAQGCAIDTSGVAYEVSNGNPAVSLGNPSTAQLAGCLVMPLDNDARMVWDVNSHIFYEDDGTWYEIAGNSTQIVGGSKAYISALDGGGNTYHLNFYVGSLTQTITGTYANWSGMNPATHPNHTVKSAINFPSDHNLNPNSASSKTAPYNQPFNVSSSDGNYYCNPFDEEHDPECVPIDNGSETCSQGGFIDNPNPSAGTTGRFISHWFVIRNYNSQAYTEQPTFTAGDQRWHIVVHIPVQDDCASGTPTCKLPGQGPFFDLIERVSSKSLPVAKGVASVLIKATGPWLIKSAYLQVGGVVNQATCTKLQTDFVAESGVCD